MKLKIWTVAADDDFGTRATVHLTQKEAYEQWLDLRLPHELDHEIKSRARAFIERGDYDGLWEWKGDQEFGDPFDTYTIDEHEIEIPPPSKQF